jgi:imidazolonepropionase-like amidohydrolase
MTTGARSNELEDPEPLQLTAAELSAVTGEAHRMGFKVSAHAEGLAGCEAAITAGADTIEHGMYLHRRPRPAPPPRHWTWRSTSASWKRASSPTC